MVAVLLPLFFNPYAHQSIEAVKVILFQGITLGMLFVAILSFIQSRLTIEDAQETRIKPWKLFRDKIKDNPLLFPTFVYGLIYIIATLFSINPLRSLWGQDTRQGTFTILCILIFFVLLESSIRERSQIDRLITSLILGSIPVVIYGWVQFFGFDPLDWITGSISSVHSTLGYSLSLGAYLALIIPFTFSRLIGSWLGSQNRLWAHISIMFMQTSCLLFTLARGAWLGLMVGCLLFLMLLSFLWKRRNLLIISTLVMLAGGYLFVSLNTSWGFPKLGNFGWLSNNLLLQARVESNNERLRLWKYTIPIIKERVVLGYGPETFSEAIWDYYPPELYEDLADINPWHPHNWFLYHFTSIGLLGILAFIWLIIGFFWVTLKTLLRSEDRNIQLILGAIIGSAAAYIIQAQFNPTSIVSLILFWFVMTLGVGATKELSWSKG